MTDLELFALLRGWVRLVLPTTEVIRAFQNAPAPVGAYLSIQDQLAWTPQGQVSRGTNTGATDALGIRISDWSVDVAIYECNGDGGLLRSLYEHSGSQATADYFANTAVSVLSVGRAQGVPKLDAKNYVREWRAELRLSVATTITEATAAMADVVFSGEVENHQVGG